WASACAIFSPSLDDDALAITLFIQACMGQSFCPLAPQSNAFAPGAGVLTGSVVSVASLEATAGGDAEAVVFAAPAAAPLSSQPRQRPIAATRAAPSSIEVLIMTARSIPRTIDAAARDV